MAIVLGIAGVYVVLCVVLWTFQERITFPAPSSPLPDPGKTIGYGEHVELTMHDGTRLVGWYLPPLGAPRRPSPPSVGSPAMAIRLPRLGVSSTIFDRRTPRSWSSIILDTGLAGGKLPKPE